MKKRIMSVLDKVRRVFRDHGPSNPWKVIVLSELVVALTVGLAVGVDWIGKSTLIDDYIRGFVLVTDLAGRQVAGRQFDAGYTGTDSWASFGGVEYNSTWLENYTYRIVPYFAYEGIVPGAGTYPTVVAFMPFADHRAFRVLGTAQPIQGWVLINDKEVSIPYDMNEAETLEVLVHELLHLQGGIFLSGGSDEFESATDAGTIEVLAAMCNDGDDLACRSFAGALRSDVASVLIRDLNVHNAEGVYQWFMDTFIRTEREQNQAEKHLRYWRRYWDERMSVMTRYGSIPIEKYIGPGVRGKVFPTGLATGNLYSDGTTVVTYGLLSFDDTAVLLYRWNILWLVAGYGSG